MTTEEHARLAEADAGTAAWRRWGPYVAERAWGSVREDYSPGGDAWEFLTHDDARSTAYRWNEDGLAGICDEQQHLTLTWAFWNGVDPVLKERAYGLTNSEGNHGEDVKDEFFYVDATPTSSWLAWHYRYPTTPFPYDQLRASRSRDEPELELADTGALDGCWELRLEVAKSAPEAMVLRLRATNTSDTEQVLHVLPTLTFRNTWSWDTRRPEPRLSWSDGILVEHDDLPPLVLAGSGTPLYCRNETNGKRWGAAGPAFPKDGINDHVVHGAATVDPTLVGTKAALHHVVTAAPGETVEVVVTLAPPGAAVPADTLATRRTEADAFYSSLAELPADEALVLRQALAGMLWGKCFYRYDVDRWLTGDPSQPAPPASREGGRNSRWRHVDARDVISMPDPWEYPWFASWDLAFHTVALAHVDPQFAKDQLVLLCREWFMHPNGQLPAYEWDFGDTNPPVHAWAALEVFRISGGTDLSFLERVFHKLLLNFTWWVNQVDAEGDDLFEGGFLGLDNIGPFDRSHVPPGIVLEQADGTAWMATYCLDLLEIALTLARHDPVYEDVATKFFEHFVRIAAALTSKGLWDEQDGFVYDLLRDAGGERPVRVHSVVGLLVLGAARMVHRDTLAALPSFSARLHRFLEVRPDDSSFAGEACPAGPSPHDHVLSVLSAEQLQRVVTRVLDEGEFLSPHGLRSLSAWHREHPYDAGLGGPPVDYEPGESRSGLFGGNSNWRGPVWMPVNVLVLRALQRLGAAHPEITVELPTGSGRHVGLAEAGDEVARRLVGLWLPGADGSRPAGSWPEGLLQFNEYFHGDTGRGLGASHQTGWTGLVADLLLRPRVHGAST